MSIKTIDDAWGGVERVDQALSQGHVSTQEASEAVNHINESWDQFADNCQKRLGVDLSTFVTDQNTFDAFGGIKQGAATGMSSVASFFNAVDSFKGSWRDPEQARQKLENGLTAIATGVQQCGQTLKNIQRTGEAIGNALLGIQGDPLLNKTGTFIGNGATGIGTFGGHLTNIGQGFANSGIISVAGRMTGAISNKVNRPQGTATGGAAFVSQEHANQLLQEEEVDSEITDAASPQNAAGDHQQSQTQKGTGTGAETGEEDYSADMMNEIHITLDGSASSEDSQCTINGKKYRLSGYSLSQELLQPILLHFSIEKEDKVETQADVVFTDTTQLIGKSFEMQASSVKTSLQDSQAKAQKAFVFKGMIIDVSASRATASTQSAYVTVASWDALLQNGPHCRSFENKSLKEIVNTVLNPYQEVKGVINPRFTDKIPYVVQYNQSDFDFVRMLAIRYGEWMYSTGEEFVFGEMKETNASTAQLPYPAGSLMSYGLQLQMNPFSSSSLLPDYYAYGQEKGIQKESAKGCADGNVHEWTEKAYIASKQRFGQDQLAARSSGGYDDGQNGEGADALLDLALKIESLSKKAALMCVEGSSKLASLAIGRSFLIKDNVQNVSGQSQDVEQKALKIIGIQHSFDYSQEYSNHFTAIPVACEYPTYVDTDLHVATPTQRAKVVANNDKQGLGRIRVQFPWQEIQSKEMKTPWLRIAVPYAGAGKGNLFIPEVGEEVMVGFEMDHPDRPYIIGTFYNGGTGKPDEMWAANRKEEGTENNIKAIRTRNGHTILFNDKGKAGLMEIYDNKGNTYHITLSADDKKITVYSAGDIEVVADRNIHIQAKGNIGIDADGSIDIHSKKNISMEASNEVSIQASRVKVR